MERSKPISSRHLSIDRSFDIPVSVSPFMTFALALAAPTAPQPPDATALAEIRAEYDGLSRAFAEADATRVIEIRTSDFTTVTPDGQLHDAAYMAELARRFFTTNRPPYSVRYTIRCSRFPARDRATLVIFQQVSRTQEVAGAMRRVDSDITQREHWRRTPLGWRLEKIDAIHDPHRWIDGVQIDPSVPYHPGVAPFSPTLMASRPCEELLSD